MASVTTRELLDKTRILSKFQGCLVGALIGDCLGSPFEGYEFVKLDELASFFTRIYQGRSSVYEFTDDTAMARSISKSLIEHHSVNVKDLAKRFTEEYFKEPNRGYGASVGAVFSGLLKSEYADPHGPASLQFDSRGSYGNGGAMRISPLAIFAYNDINQNMMKQVEDITRITHSNRDAILGAQLQCAAVHYALHHEAPLVPADFLTHLVSVMENLESVGENDTSPPKKKDKQEGSQGDEENDEPLTYSGKLKKIQEMICDEHICDEKAVDVLGHDVSALGSVNTAVYSFVRACHPLSHIPSVPNDNGFTRTIIHAISLGGDTDTIATMAGAMAGALYGLDSIPWDWQKSCESLQETLQFGKDLAHLVKI